MFTGRDDIHKTNMYKVYGGYSALTYVSDVPHKRCVPVPENPANYTSRTGYSYDCKLWKETEIVTGTRDGTQSNLYREGKTAENIDIYVTEGKRIVTFSYDKDVKFRGIDLRRYRIDEKNLLVATAGKYFLDEDYVIPMTRYLGGYDGFLSQGQFYAKTPKPDLYERGFDPASGFKPNEEDHATYLDVEPLTGRTMSARKRLQIGFSLHRDRLSILDPWSRIFANFNKSYPLYVPLVYVNEGKDISEDDAKSFVKNIYDNRKMAKNIFTSFLTVGVVMFSVSLGWMVYLCKKGPDTTSTN